MKYLKQLLLIGTCSTLLLATPHTKTNACCGFLYVCEVIVDLGTGAGMMIYPGAALAFDPTAIAPRAVGLALFIQGFRRLFSCCHNNTQNTELNSLKKQVKKSERRNWNVQKEFAKLQRELMEIKKKLKG